MRRSILLPLAAVLLGACATNLGTGFSLVAPGDWPVARRSMSVTPTVAWNRAPRGQYDIAAEENWTLNGPLLDNLSFVGGLESGRAIVRQRRREERQVPPFRADMTPPELAGMIETFYRIRAGSVRFEMTGMQPRRFLGRDGFQFDFDHLDSSEIERRGRAVGAVVDDRLYLVLLEGARMHYFPAALPEFERIVESARLTG
jgi:hypothetical protein